MTSSIKSVLASFFAILAIVSALQGGATYLQVVQAEAGVSSIAEAQLPSLTAIRDIGTALLRIRNKQERLILSELDDNVIENNAKELSYERDDLTAAQAHYEPLISAPDEQKTYHNLSETLGIYLRISEPLASLMRAKRTDEARQLFLKPWLRVLFASADTQLRSAVALNQKRAREHASASAAALGRAKRVALLASALAACLACLAVAVSYFRFLRPLGQLTYALRELAVGNTAVATLQLERRHDEIGAVGRAVEVFRESLIRTQLAEAEERQTRLFVRNVAASTPDGIIGFDGRGTVTFWNEAAEGLLGFTADEVMGRFLGEVVPSLAGFALSQGAPRSGIGESALLNRAGEAVAIELSCSRWEQDGQTMLCIILRDIRARKQAETVLHRLAHHDTLTELPNRLVLMSSIADALRAETSFALLMVDLDHFKQVNDAFGHATGDGILRIAAERLLGCVTRDDMVTRIGGDEFIVLLAGQADPLQVCGVARAIIDSLAEPFILQGRTIHLGGSVGIALAPAHGRDADELMVCADLALYAAKAQGRRMSRLFTPELRGAALRDSACRQELPRAVENGEFVLFYQPQVRLDDGALTGAEALIRWQHPEFGLLAPDTFISVLESSHLAEHVGDWVIRTACRQVQAWRRIIPGFRMGVNLSSAHFRSGRLPDTVRRALADHDLPGTALELEITERIILHHDDRLIRPLQELQQLGVSIAFDDYGTGYASLSLLKRFPLTRLKVDRTFVRSMGESVEDAAIIRTILQLGQSLGLSVIVEGIETEDQRDRLRRMGCTEGQGYLFGRPLPAPAFEALALEGRIPLDLTA